MIDAPDPLIAMGVVASTAATDAVYVLFTAAVAVRRRERRGQLEQHLVPALSLCSDQ